jgi:hypothetical protein
MAEIEPHQIRPLPPFRSLAHALIVRDYDEALAFYTGTLAFTLVEDT